MATDQRQRYIDVLMERIREGEYPSTELLDRVEASFRSWDEVTSYLEILFEKVEASQYPSKQLLDRIDRLTAAMARAPQPDADEGSARS